MANPPPSLTEVATAAGLIATAVVTVGSFALRLSRQWRTQQSQAAASREEANSANAEESRRLREELRTRKEEAEEELRAVRLELSQWERAFWTLYNSANRMLARCGSSVGTALSFLDGSHAEPAKKELSKLDTELKDYHLPDAPKAE